jgi:hypothetical protein
LIRKTALYFLLLCFGLFGFRFLHYKGLLKQLNGFYGKLNVVFLNQNTYNTLFLGSSRAEMHYDIRCIDSLTSWDSYNVSMAGASPMMAFSVLKIYLNRSASPERVFYEVDLNRLSENYSEIYNFNNYFAYLSDPLVRAELASIDRRMNHFYWNPFYSLPYTGLKNISTSLHGWLNLPNDVDALYYRGFMKDTINTHMQYKASSPALVYLSNHNRNYLDSIVGLCKEKNIHLYLLSSPIFSGGQLDMKNKEHVKRQMEFFAKKNRIPYWDLSSLPFCNRRDLFVDNLHLNAKGAELFSQYFVDYFNTKSRGITLN